MHLSFRLLEFNPYDRLRISTDDKELNPYEDNKEFIVQMFGITEEGKSVSIYVEGFKPFFYVKVGDDWTEIDKRKFMSHLTSKMGKYYEASIVKSKLISRKKLCMFDAGKLHKFILIKFINMPALNRAKKLWYTDTTTAEEGFVRTLNEDGYLFNDTNIMIYETNIPPLLRLFHIKEVSPSGWVRISTDKARIHKTRLTSCHHEYTIHYSHILSLPYKETPVPYKKCSFDIEAGSSHGDFPLPIKNYKKLATDIVDIWMYGDKKSGTHIEKNEGLLRDIIFTAFREIIDYKSCASGSSSADNAFLKEEINIVYPKTKNIKFSELENIFNNWIKIMPATESFSSKSDQATSDLIENFEESQSDLYEDHDIDIGDTAGDNKIDDNSTENTYYRKRTYIKKYRNVEGTIVDLLNDEKCARDTKIMELTKTLSKMFPELEGDKVTYIGSVFEKHGADKPYLNHAIVLGGCSIPKDVENCVIETYETEQEVLLAWRDLIQREDPDIIMGYNVDNFDYNFMDKRAQELSCRKEFLMLSRIKNEVCLNRDWKTGIENIESASIVLASGQHDSRYIKMTGRLQIDLYTYFRRNYQLSSFKLDSVSGHFIGDDVKEILHDDEHNITTIRSKNLTGLEVGSYINFEQSSHSTDYYKGGQKFEIKYIDYDNSQFGIAGIETPDMKKKVKWCLAKDDVTPKDIFRLANGSLADKAIIAKYCIKDCKLVLDLLNKIDIITEFIEMSKLCNVPMGFLISRGQGIKLTSYISKKCREKNTLMPVLQKSMDDEGYEGAIVLEPKNGIYLNDPVACVDYSSLYPSSMISENISHDSKVWTKEYDLDDTILKETGYKNEQGEYIYDNLPDYKYVDITYDTYKWMRKTPKAAATKEKVGYKVCRFAQFPEGKAIMPAVLDELLLARKTTRKQIPEQKDEFMKNILDKRQLSIKVTANSLYGGCGAKTSAFYDKDVAASCTATGRKLLIYGKEVIEGAYSNRIVTLKNGDEVRVDAEYVYGDTDSVFFKFNPKNPKKELTDPDYHIKGKEALKITIELAQEAGALATKFLKKPHDLEYEKTFWPFILLTKKRYAGILYEFNPDKGKFKSMGLVLRRRDNASIVKDIYGGTIDIILADHNIESAVKFVRSELKNMIEEKCSLDKLIVTKSLRSFYANPMQIAHKVLAERMGKRDPGNKPGSGDRIPYAYVKIENKKALQGEKIEHPVYIRENSLQIDYPFYITNQIMKPLQQLFALSLEDIRGFRNKKGYTLHKWQAELDKLKEKYPEPDKYKKKEEELRCKEIKSLIFDEFIQASK